MNISNIASLFGISPATKIEQIHPNAWCIDTQYVLKSGRSHQALVKSAMLSTLLLKERILAPEYIKTADGALCVQANDSFFVLMKRMKGAWFDAYTGNPYTNGLCFGRLLAALHVALKKIDMDFDCDEVDCIQELDTWITKSIREHAVPISPQIIADCRSFAALYKALPRQLIHRDVHDANLLFDNKIFSGWLDFDMAQKNVRLYDLCYLGACLLVENYTDEARLALWRKIFLGIIDGYGGISPLTAQEKSAIPDMMLIIELTFCAFFAQNGQPKPAAGCAAFIQWLDANKGMIAAFTKG